MSRNELVQEIISVAAPIFIKKALKYLSAGRSPNEDEISMEVIAECKEVWSDTNDTVQYAGPYGVLVATLCIVVDDLANDIKEQITQEVMMKIHVEIENVKGELMEAAGKRQFTDLENTTDTDYGGFRFDVTDNVHLDAINGGYSSIAQYSAQTAQIAEFGAVMDNVLGSNVGSNIGSNVGSHQLETDISSNDNLWDKMFNEKCFHPAE